VSTRQALAIVLLILVATGSRWWLIQTREDDRRANALPAARSEYTLDNFDLLVMDKQGLPSFQIAAPHLEKQPSDGSVQVRKPLMHLFEQGVKTWRIEAQNGWVSADGEQVKLMGDVLMTKDMANQQEPLVIRARDLKIFPQKERVESSEAVQINRPGTQINGIGLRARLKPEKYELLSEVKVRYEPKKIQ